MWVLVNATLGVMTRVLSTPPTPATTEVVTQFVLLSGGDGSLAADPVDDGRTFHDEESALNWYEEFLTTWTESTIDEDGELVEVDNHLAPPPPPDPDAPTSTLKDAPEDFGAAW